MTLAAAEALTVEGNELFQNHAYADAAARFERAAAIYPAHYASWKGLGHALLCMQRPAEAARAFDRAIGLRPDSATALWGGALAHADLGHSLIAQNYLRRVLVLQPSWLEMARSVAQLAPFLAVSAHVGDIIRAAFGTYSSKTYRHATVPERALEVARIDTCPSVGYTTFVSLGLCNWVWPSVDRPRIELALLASATTGHQNEADVGAAIIANAAFHMMENVFYPQPGSMIRDVVGVLGLGDLSTRLPHLYITVPRMWDIALPLDHGPPVTTLCHVIPVSEGEYQRWHFGGAEEFEASLLHGTVDITDMRRSGRG